MIDREGGQMKVLTHEDKKRQFSTHITTEKKKKTEMKSELRDQNQSNMHNGSRSRNIADIGRGCVKAL